MIYVKASLAGLGAAFVVFLYTAWVMAYKTKVTGRGVLVGYFGDPFFWITMVVVSVYVFRLTTYK